MAVIVTPYEGRLAIRVNIGDAVEPVFRTRSWGNVKAAASDQDVWDVADPMRALFDDDVVDVRRYEYKFLDD